MIHHWLEKGGRSWRRFRTMWREEGTGMALRVFVGKVHLLFLRHLLRRRLIRRYVPTIGLHMYLDLADSGFSRTIFYRGVHEPLATQIMRQEIAPGMTVIDIGANMGYYVLLEARAVGPGGVIYAIEPVPATFAILRKNVDLNRLDNVRLFQVALASQNGTAIMYVMEKLNWSHLDHNLWRSPRMERIWSTARQTIRVPTMTLDTFVRTHNIERVDFLRMDVEGYEMEVIWGSQETIARHAARYLFKVFMEVHPFLAEDRIPFLDMVRVLFDLGLKVKYIGYRETVVAKWPALREVVDYLAREDFREAPHLLFSNEVCDGH